MEELSFAWRAAEYEYREKNIFSHIIISVVGLTTVIIALWQKNFFFAVFIAIATIMLIVLGKQRPRILDFSVDDEKITIGTSEYPYDTIENFMVRSRPEHLDELVVKRKVYINPHLHIPIDAQLVIKVHALLIEKIPEVPYDESLLENIVEWLGI